MIKGWESGFVCLLLVSSSVFMGTSVFLLSVINSKHFSSLCKYLYSSG